MRNEDFIDRGNCDAVSRLANNTRDAETVRYAFHGVNAACTGARAPGSDTLCRDGNSR